MTISRGLVSFRTYALGFAIALSPALMQTEANGCEPDTALSVLELEAPPGTPVTWEASEFTPQVRQYWDSFLCVEFPACVESGLLFRAYAEDPSSTVHYKYTFRNCTDCPDPISGSLPDGGGEVLLEDAFAPMATGLTWGGELQLDVECPAPSTGICMMARYSVVIEPWTGPGCSRGCPWGW